MWGAGRLLLPPLQKGETPHFPLTYPVALVVWVILPVPLGVLGTEQTGVTQSLPSNESTRRKSSANPPPVIAEGHRWGQSL